MLLSGGIDSATCLYLARRKYRARALTFEYRGIAESELGAARAVARSAGVRDHRFFRLPDLMEAGDISAADFGRMPTTYIPMRNGIFYSVAASYAEEVRADLIMGGHNRDDVRTFPDTGPEFFDLLEKSFWAASRILRSRKMRILRPLGGKTKVQVVMLASSLGVPLEKTWSCHHEGKTHCWQCDGCVNRTASFERAGIPDPLR